MKKHKIYIGIGSNLERGDLALIWAQRKLAIAFRGTQRFSTPQQTQPIDFPSANFFTNQVALIETSLPPIIIRPLLKSIERQYGRKPEDKEKGIVKLDLDLLCLDDEVLKSEDWERPYIKEAIKELS